MNSKEATAPTCSNCCSNPKSLTQWNVSEVLTSEAWDNLNYAVLILNRPLTQNSMFLINLWNNATVAMTVDGGTCQWELFLNQLSEEIQQSVQSPHMVTGDFDSITNDILEKYKRKGCKIVHTPDQNNTDFTKAIMELNCLCQNTDKELHFVIAIAQASGRMDQIMGNIQTLFLSKEILNGNTKLYLLADDSLSWLLNPGGHVINIPEEIRTHPRTWCSLVPIGETCERVTTSGLKWNLDNRCLKFGGLVSTSNTYDMSNIVKIECSHPLLWSMKIPNLVNKAEQTVRS